VGIAIKVDEDLPVSLKQELRNAGHDVLSVADQGWSGRGDGFIRSRVRREGRLLITADKGFADARFPFPRHQGGIILLRLNRESLKGYVMLIRRLLAAADLRQLRGCITVVTMKGIRMRRV
jgi:predicted nuclease of predicted toxin-antitoxin system